jgi:glycosyltransferase involved in cell wall biosynthesis
MRVGIVTGEYPPMQGGVGAYSRILASELGRQGHKVFVFSTRDAQNTDVDVTLENRVKVWGPGSLRAVLRWSKQCQLDVLNLQYQTAAYRMSPWIHLLPLVMGHVPTVTTFHDLRYPYLFPKAGHLRKWVVALLARSSDGVIVTNHEDFEQLKHLPNVRLIPIGSNIRAKLPSDFDPYQWREKAGAGCEDFLLAYFGLINRSKGLEILLQSVAKLGHEGIPVRLLIVGDVGTSDPTNAAYARQVNELIEELGLTPVVTRTGYLQDEATVGSFLAASDLVVLPYLDGASYRRGSLMAAIGYTCAIVTSTPRVRVPAFIDGENVRLVSPEDVEGVVTALRELYHDPELRQRLRQGAAVLAQHFAWYAIASDYANFLRWVIETAA